MRIALAVIVMIIPMTGCSAFHNFFMGPNGPNTIRIVVLGQSNVDSPAQGNQAPYYSQTGHVYVADVYNEYGTGSFAEVSPTANHPMRGSISWLYLGDLLYAHYGQDVWIYNRGRAGNNSSKIRDHWQEYADLIRQVKPQAVLWVQGESDYHDSIATEDSYENLKFLIQACGGQWIVALDTSPTELGKSWLGSENRILAAQQKIIAENLALQGPNLMTLHYEAQAIDGNGGEFIGDGLRKHGEEWFHTLTQTGLL